MADVLVVEDNTKTCQVFCRVALRLGHTVRAASSFDAACAAIKERSPDLVLTDWNLSEYDSNTGVDVAHFSLANNPDTHIILITGNDINQLKIQTSALPIKAYLRKPVDLSDLLSVFNDIVDT